MPTADGASGPPVDKTGMPAQDPTENVKALNEAGLKRSDDILNLNMQWLNRYTKQLDKRQDDLREEHEKARTKDERHFRELLRIQELHFTTLMATESKRLNDIRAVDVAAVSEAAKVVAAAQLALANQLTVTNDTTRLANQTLASSISDNLSTTIKPIVDGLAEVQRRQYEGVGAKTQQTETKVDRRDERVTQGQIVGYIFGASGLIIAVLLGYLRATGK